MLGDSIIFPGWLSVILTFSKHLSRTSFAVIYPVFLLPPPHRVCSFPFGSSCLWPCSLCLPQPSPGSEIPILPPFPRKSRFPKTLIALIVLSWTPPTLFWRNGKLPALFQQNPVSVLSTLCFAAVWNLPEGNSLLLQQHHVGDCCHCASCSNFWAFSAKNVFFSACEAGSSCWTSWYFFPPACWIIDYCCSHLSRLFGIWSPLAVLSTCPSKSAHLMNIISSPWADHWWNSEQHRTESVSCASSTTRFILSFHSEITFQVPFPDEVSELLEQEGPCW